MNKKIGIIVGILTILAMIWAAVSYIDTRYAKAEEQKAIEKRLDYKIENDKLVGMQERQFQLNRQYPAAVKRPEVIDKQIKELDSDVEMQRSKVKKLEAK